MANLFYILDYGHDFWKNKTYTWKIRIINMLKRKKWNQRTINYGRYIKVNFLKSFLSFLPHYFEVSFFISRTLEKLFLLSALCNKYGSSKEKHCNYVELEGFNIPDSCPEYLTIEKVIKNLTNAKWVSTNVFDIFYLT